MTDTHIRAGFVHRHNADGTVDSICQSCFMTVAKEASELELMKDEQLHDCQEFAREKDCASRERFSGASGRGH